MKRPVFSVLLLVGLAMVIGACYGESSVPTGVAFTAEPTRTPVVQERIIIPSPLPLPIEPRGLSMPAGHEKTLATDGESSIPVGPIVINRESNKTIRGVHITNPNGDCIIIRNSSNIRIENSEIGPCLGEGISIFSSNNIEVTQTKFEDVRAGVYAVESQTINVNNNEFRNIQGPMPRGQLVQFNQVSGTGNRVMGNVGINVFGESDPSDLINMFKSSGTPEDPIQIIGNELKGGGPSSSGCGILIGDHGGSYIIVKDNILVDPGQCGVGVAGGFHLQVLDNKIYAKRQYFTNVGLYVWAQPKSEPVPCGNITVRGNQVNWTNMEGNDNHAWNNGNCGAVTGWDDNEWGAAIDDSIWYALNKSE